MHSSIDENMGCFYLLAILQNAAGTWVYKYLFETLLSVKRKIVVVKRMGCMQSHWVPGSSPTEKENSDHIPRAFFLGATPFNEHCTCLIFLVIAKIQGGCMNFLWLW